MDISPGFIAAIANMLANNNLNLHIQRTCNFLWSLVPRMNESLLLLSFYHLVLNSTVGLSARVAENTMIKALRLNKNRKVMCRQIKTMS